MSPPATPGRYNLTRPAWPPAIHVAAQIALVAALVLGAMALVVRYGYVRYDPVTGGHLNRFVEYDALSGHLAVAALLLFIAVRGAQLAWAPQRLQWVTRYAPETLATTGLVVALAALQIERMTALPDALAWRELLVNVYLAAMIIITLLRIHMQLVRTSNSPGRTLAISFAVLILLGSGLLMLPRSNVGHVHTNPWVNYVDCLFTATSATCVTGLVVRDTGSDFTMFGQTIILGLMQLGGLGIMIFGTVYAVLMGGHVSLQEQNLMQNMLNTERFSEMERTVKFMVVFTIGIEIVAACMCYPMWQDDHGGHRAFTSIFHTVSAFCNAGFALQPDSLVSHSHHWQVYGVLMPLIILGGLGFPVLKDAGRYLVLQARRVFGQRRVVMLPSMRMQIHTRLVLACSVILLAAGMFLVLLCEWPQELQGQAGRAVRTEDVLMRQAQDDQLSGRPMLQRILDATFMSASCRTAGFNTVDISTGTVHQSTLLVMMVLMFIGGSPASCAGGIKTTTMAIIVVTLLATLRNREEPSLYARSVSVTFIRRAFSIAILMIGMIVTGVGLLLAFQPDVAFVDLVFEAVSAAGTVGLSTGITSTLTVPAKLTIIVLMFVGRIGPMTLLLALADSRKRADFSYPPARVIIG